MSAGREPIEPLSSESIEVRYEILRTLGQGAAGVVYKVRDRDSGETLALKKLLRMEPKSVARLKQEFRALAALHHPNLIKLYDLGRTDDVWYITMEYLDGADLISDLRASAGASSDSEVTSTLDLSEPPANQNRAPENLDVICGAFGQLARGLRALHRAGKLHRDLKPSNVMVAQGRVVVLDFGLVREFGETAVTVTQEDTIAGTPAYMAPEQVRNATLSDACDWYAFGVMLYEALSGELPIDGRLNELLRRKLSEDPPSIARLVPGLPHRIEALCTALLQREPNARPGFDAIAPVLAAFAPDFEIISQASMFEQLAPSRFPAQPAFVGRQAEHAELERMFEEAASGTLSVAHVRGIAGAGKSALVEHFVQRLQDASHFRAAGAPEVLVLRARCYEREAMPFKALDGLLDALVSYFARLNDVVVSYMLPPNVEDLVRVFPALGKVPAVKTLLVSRPRREPARERARAEQALRDLLHRVASRCRLVLWIDDLQWADLDSVTVLKSWIDSSEPPPLLLVLSYRSDELDTNNCLKLLAEVGASRRSHDLIVDLMPLVPAEMRELCAQALGRGSDEQRPLIERIVAESQGSPFLARQLLMLSQVQIDRGVADWSALTIGGLVSQLMGLLNEDERAVLQVLAVAGRPIAPQVALGAANIRQGGSSQLHALNSMNLTRMRIVNGERRLEIYHQRMGEALLAALSDSERQIMTHRLLTVLVMSGETDPDWLHLVATAAGQNDAAVRYGRLAAERATASLAFERAVELYRDCIARSDDASGSELGELWCKLGAALDACGYGIRAAEAYLEAAARAPQGERVELKRVAAMHYVRGGQFERGEALVREVLAALDIEVPSSEAGLLAAIAWERGRLALRGLEFSWRNPDQIDPDRHRRSLIYCSLSFDTQAYDPIRAGLFAARALRTSLELGSPSLVSWAMVVMASLHGVVGSERDAAHANELLVRAQALAVALKEPLALTHVFMGRAVCAFLLGRAEDALALSKEAERYYNMHRGAEEPGEYYLRSTLRTTRVGALFQLGRFRDARKELQETVEAARAADSRTILLQLSLVIALDDIAQNEPQRSRERLNRERAQLPAQGFGALHLVHMIAVMRVACALGDYAWARDIVDVMWPRFQRSIGRHSVFATLAYSAHARYLLNRHVIERRSGDPNALVRDDLRALHKLSDRVGPAAYTRFRARVAYISGGRDRALSLYRQHVESCAHERYFDEIERANWALWRVLGGEEGARLCAEAIARLRERGMLNPEREIESHFPELVELERSA